MLDRAVKIKKSLTSVSKELNEEKPSEDIGLNSDHFSKASLVLDLLEPFNQIKFLNKIYIFRFFLRHT